MTKNEAGRLGGSAPHGSRGLQSSSSHTRDHVSKAGVKARKDKVRIQEFDDLALVTCPHCKGKKCDKCKDGQVVRKQIKYFEQGEKE